MATSQEPELQGSDEQEGMLCEVCRKKRISRPAEGFCVDCVKYFCSSCLGYHSEFLPSHVQKGKSSMPQEVCLSPCPTHGDEIIKFYCQKCDSFCCDVCKADDHDRCSSVKHLPQLVEETNLNEKYRFRIESIENFLTNIREREAKVCEKTEFEKTHATEAKHKLILEREKVQAWLDGTFLSLEQEINTLETRNEKNLQTERNELHHLKSQLESLALELREKKEANNKCHRFMSLRKVEKMLRAYCAFEFSVGEQEMTRYHFAENENLEKALKDLSLGSVRHNPAN